MFFQNKSILCPYCLDEIRYRNQITECPCKQKMPIPDLYEQGYHQKPPIPPFFVQMMGWSSVGKTVYLQSLTLMLRNMSKFWRNGYASMPITQSAFEFMTNVQRFMKEGRMPIPTQRRLQDAYIMQLTGMDRWGDRTLIMRDVAGETFNTLDFEMGFAPYLLHVPTILFMISLPNLESANEYRSMDDLFTGFINTLTKEARKLGRKGKELEEMRREIVVVLSKADKMHSVLPQGVRDYLFNDPLTDAVRRDVTISQAKPLNMKQYMADLYTKSDEIGQWLRDCYPSADQMFAQAQRRNMGMHYTLMTSTGADPITDTVIHPDGRTEEVSYVVDMKPRRVLDPFFMALDFSSQPSY